MTPIRTRLVVLVALASCAPALLAQESPKPDASPAADPMRGPTISEKPKPATLVKRDMSGNVERLETRPEQAAIDLLALTPEQRKPIEDLFNARLVKVNKLLQENYEIILKLQAARQGGAKPAELRPLIQEFRPAAAALLSPTLAEQVSGVLPEDKRAEFKRIVEEYTSASVAQDAAARRGPGASSLEGESGKAERPRAAAAGAERAELGLLLRELGRTLKGIVDDRKQHMEAFLKAIDATPEQEAKIRAITREAAEANRKSGGNGGIGEPTQEAKMANWRKILDLLTPEQRKKAIESRRG